MPRGSGSSSRAPAGASSSSRTGGTTAGATSSSRPTPRSTTSTKLYEMHGDWQLALASYNWGENAVARAIAKNRAAGKPTDYASLPMPAETRHYIPKLQALKNIINNPEPLGIDIGPIPNQPYFATVTKQCATSTSSSPRASPRCRWRSSSRSTRASAGRTSALRSPRASCCRRTRSTCSTTTSRPWATSRWCPGRPTTRSRARPSSRSPRSTAWRSAS